MKNFLKISFVIAIATMMMLATVSCADETGKPNTPTTVTTSTVEQETPTVEEPTREVTSQQTTESGVTEAPVPTDPVVPDVGLTPGEDADGDQFGDWIPKA